MKLNDSATAMVNPTHARSTRSGPVVSRCVEVDSHRVMLDIAGPPSAPTVLLLHGIPGWRGTWNAITHLLAEEAFVVAPDLVGFGESSAAPNGFHAREQARTLAAATRSLKRERLHVVGFDFGGPVAVMCASIAPELVASVTLVATNVRPDTPVPPPLRLVRAPIVGDLFSCLYFGTPGLTLMWWAAVRNRARYPLHSYQAALRFPQGVESTRRVFAHSLRNLTELYAPIETALSSLRVPCDVVWGDSDPFFPVAVGQRTAAAIPGATFTLIRDCGHFIPGEAPAELIEVIRRRIRQSAGA